VFAEHGLQPGEFDILATLRRAAGSLGVGAGALASSAMVTSGAITNRIDRLVAKGLVTRDLDPTNRRAVRIALTPAGRRLVDRAVVEHVAERRLLAGLDQEAQEQLAALLKRLLVGMGAGSVGGTLRRGRGRQPGADVRRTAGPPPVGAVIQRSRCGCWLTTVSG
jgi:DNA-binding MarR family transcriptional regulator